MKKWISLFLCAVLLLGQLTACGSKEKGSQTEHETLGTVAGEQDEILGVFSVGYAKADISPTESVPMGGYSDSDTRWSQNTERPLELICVAMTDAEGETVLFFAADLLMAYDHVAENLRLAVSKATGVPQDHIIYHVTHNHYGPETNKRSEVSIERYILNQSTQAARIAQEALADRKAAQLYTGFTRLEGVNFVRHYLLADGTYKGEGVGSVAKDQIIGHTNTPDNLLQAVKFVREGGKDVVLVNWQGHLMAEGAGYNAANSCSPGVMRQALETTGNCLPVFILGGSGNMNNTSQIREENRFDSYTEHGEYLAQQVMDLTYQSAQTGNVILKESIMSIVNRNGEEKKLPLYAFSVGELAFVTAPGEIFSDNAVAVRDASKFPMTIYASCANGYNGYLPTPKPFDYYAYEVRITKYPMGTAEVLQAEHTKMLDEIFSESGLTETEKAPSYLTAEFEPVTDGVAYSPAGTAVTAVENGFYALQLYDGFKIRNMLAISKEVAEDVLSQSGSTLLFNEQNVIVGIAP